MIIGEFLGVEAYITGRHPDWANLSGQRLAAGHCWKLNSHLNPCQLDKYFPAGAKTAITVMMMIIGYPKQLITGICIVGFVLWTRRGSIVIDLRRDPAQGWKVHGLQPMGREAKPEFRSTNCILLLSQFLAGNGYRNPQFAVLHYSIQEEIFQSMPNYCYKITPSHINNKMFDLSCLIPTLS